MKRLLSALLGALSAAALALPGIAHANFLEGYLAECSAVTTTSCTKVTGAPMAASRSRLRMRAAAPAWWSTGCHTRGLLRAAIHGQRATRVLNRGWTGRAAAARPRSPLHRGPPGRRHLNSADLGHEPKATDRVTPVRMFRDTGSPRRSAGSGRQQPSCA